MHIRIIVKTGHILDCDSHGEKFLLRTTLQKLFGIQNYIHSFSPQDVYRLVCVFLGF